MESYPHNMMICPRTREPLSTSDGWLSSPGGARYPCVDGIPVLLDEDSRATIGIAEQSLRVARDIAATGIPRDGLYLETIGLSPADREGVRRDWEAGMREVDPAASHLVAAAGGFMYKHMQGRLSRYPIPVFPADIVPGARVLDVGCNWGRWSLAAAQLGGDVTGIDPSLGAVAAMKRVATQLNLRVSGVVGDARRLPFPDNSFDVVYSYSVIQHFSKDDARDAFAEMARVLRPGGTFLVQMPLKTGVRCLQHQLARGFREPKDFEVRYWSIGELRRTVTPLVSSPRFFVDCFFGIGIRPEDAGLMPGYLKIVIGASEALRMASRWLKPLVHVADSVFVAAEKPPKRG